MGLVGSAPPEVRKAILSESNWSEGISFRVGLRDIARGDGRLESGRTGRPSSSSALLLSSSLGVLLSTTTEEEAFALFVRSTTQWRKSQRRKTPAAVPRTMPRIFLSRGVNLDEALATGATAGDDVGVAEGGGTVSTWVVDEMLVGSESVDVGVVAEEYETTVDTGVDDTPTDDDDATADATSPEPARTSPALAEAETTTSNPSHTVLPPRTNPPQSWTSHAPSAKGATPPK